jgi:hypothetical protein
VREAQGLEMIPAMGEEDVEDSLQKGQHALFVDGSLRVARKWFEAAYQAAERRGDPLGLARAALGLGGLWVHEHRTIADAAMVRARQERALSMVHPQSLLALRLRVRLAAEEDYHTGGHAAILAMVAEARQAGRAVALVEALSLAHHCVLGPEHGGLRRELARELMAEASKTDRRGDVLMGLLWHTVDLFLSADRHAARALAELRDLLERHDHLAVGYVVDTIQVMRTIRSGRFEQAEVLATACAERGAAAGDLDATGWYGGQLGVIRWFQGRIAELVPMLSQLVASPMLSAVDNSHIAGLAVAAATAGDRRAATGALARLRGKDLADLPRSSSWLASMYCVAEAAHLLDDAELSAQAHELLAPFAGLPAIASLGVACLGSIHHSLGVASLTTGHVDRAVDHLREAVRGNLGLGHWPAVVLSRARLAQALALRDGPRDETARRELALATEEATALGMTLPADMRRDSVVLAGGADNAGGQSPVVVCQRRGRQWRVELGERAVLVAHSVGMAHLAMLLANPGCEIPATDLAAGAGLAGTAKPGTALSAQPVLDEVAKREYKKRLAELNARIDELEAMGEPEQADAVRGERDWLITELAAAAGLGGRQRQFAGNEERARIAVGKAIRRALARITEADQVMGDELRACVQTGLRCCYRPG